MIKAYIDGNKIVIVDKGPNKDGGFTFYRKTHLAERGSRIRGRKERLWFSKAEEAQAALEKYAAKKKWLPAKQSDIEKFLQKPKTKTRYMGPLFEVNFNNLKKHKGGK